MSEGRSLYTIFVYDERPDGLNYYQGVYSLVIDRLPKLEQMDLYLVAASGLGRYRHISGGNTDWNFDMTQRMGEAKLAMAGSEKLRFTGPDSLSGSCWSR